MKLRALIVLAVMLAATSLAQPAFATHFDGDPATGSFDPQLQVTSTASLVNRPSTVTFRLTQQDHEDPAAVFWLRSPGDWQFAFDQLRAGQPAAGWPTGSASQRCESTIDGLYDSADNTPTPPNTDTSKRHNARFVRAEKIGTILLRAHVDGISRPGDPITWSGDVAFGSYDASTSTAELCLLLVTSDSRVVTITDTSPGGCSGAAPRRRCDDIEAVTEIVAAFTASRVTLGDGRQVWETPGDLTDLVKDTDVVQRLHGSALEFTTVLLGRSVGNWNTAGAIDFSRTSAVSGTKTFEGVFQTCPAAPDSSWGACTSNKGQTSDPTVGGTVTRQIPITLGLPVPALTSPADGAFITNADVTVTGTSDPSATIRVYDNGTPAGDVVADGSGAWTGTFFMPEGAHTLSARTVDAGGQSAMSATRTITVDVPPAPPIIAEPGEGATVGAGSIRVTGIAQPGSDVKVYGSSPMPLATARADTTGAWATTITLTTKTSHSIVARASDRGGEGAPSAPRSFTVTTAVPVIVSPEEDGALPSTAVHVVGTSEPGSTVELAKDGAPLATAIADPTGAWSADLELAEGTHVITAVATSLDTKVSPPLVRTFAVDLTAPDAPAIASPADGDTIRSILITFAGTAEPRARVSVVEGDATLAQAVATTTGAWSVTALVTEGTHTVEAIATDRAGNVGPASAPVSFTAIDPLKIESPVEGGIYPTSVRFSLATDPSATEVRIYEDDTEVTRAQMGGGRWTGLVTFSPGAHTITVRTVNGGVLSPPSTPRSFAVDGSAPSVTVGGVIDGVPVSAAGGTLSGTALDDRPFDSGIARVYVMYFVPGGPITQEALCVGCSTGAARWYADPSDVLTQPGVYRARVVAHDLTGNVGTASAIVVR